MRSLLFTNMYINKFLSFVSVSSKSVRLHNRINGVRRMTFFSFHLFSCRCADRSVRPNLSHPLSSIWALVVLFGLVLSISNIRYYFQKYDTLPNRSGGLNIRLDLRTLILPSSAIVSPLLFMSSSSSDFFGSNASAGPASVTSLSISTCTSSPSDLLQHSKVLLSSSNSTFRTLGFDAEIAPSSSAFFYFL